MFFKKQTEDSVLYHRLITVNNKRSPTGLYETFYNNNSLWYGTIAPRMPVHNYVDQNEVSDIISTSITHADGIALIKTHLPEGIKQPLVNHVNRRQNYYRSSYREDNIVEFMEQEPGLIANYEVNPRGYYRSSIEYNGDIVTDHIVQTMLIKHQTEDYISPYSKTVIDKFTSDTPFIELEVSENSFTRDISSHMVINGHFRSYRDEPHRKWLSTYNSPLAIDSISAFSYIPESYKDALIEKFSGHKHLCAEISSFYRGSDESEISFKEVRANKILKGNYIFPVIIKADVLNQETFEYETKKVLVLAIFRNWDRVVRYAKSREFIADFLEQLNFAGGLKYFDPEGYQAKMEALYGKHIRYWDGITRVWAGEWKESLEEAIVQEEAKVTPTSMSHLFGIEAAQNSEVTVNYNDISAAYKDLQAKKESLSSTILRSQRQITQHNQEIENYKRYLANAEQSLAAAEKLLASSVSDHEATSVAFASIQDDYLWSKSAYENHIQNLQPDLDSAATWISNLEKTGIIIEQIVYYDYNKEEQVYIHDDPSIAVKAKQDSNISLESITFRTTKPVIIHVDRGSAGSSCKKVVGGPYRVRITANGINISLISSSACFGWHAEGNTMWIHPHTASFHVRTNDSWINFTNSFVGRNTNGCLGEASPILYNAFKNKDIKTAIFGAMTWVTSANSTDTWGKHYKYFPKLSEVNVDNNGNVDQITNAEKVLDEEAIDNIAEELSLLIEEEYVEEEVEEQIQQEETQQEVVLEQPVQETLPEQTPILDVDGITRRMQEILQDPNPNLRHAGTPGYTPYGT